MTRDLDAAMQAIDALLEGATPERVRAALSACIGTMGPPSAGAAFVSITKLATCLDVAERGRALAALSRLSHGDAV